MGGPDMAPQTPQALGPPRRSRDGPRYPDRLLTSRPRAARARRARRTPRTLGVAERWVVEDGVDERVDRPAHLQHHEPHVHELGRDLADDVYPEQRLVGIAEDQLQLAAEIPGDLSARVGAVERAAHAVVDLLAAA